MSLQVAVGILINANNEILITQRPLNVDYGGFWEFPGGKVEDSESPYNALVRELEEETGLTVLAANLLTKIHYQHKFKEITLFVYQTSTFQGIASCRETQLDLRWVNRCELHTYSFPKANQAIINMLCNE